MTTTSRASSRPVRVGVFCDAAAATVIASGGTALIVAGPLVGVLMDAGAAPFPLSAG